VPKNEHLIPAAQAKDILGVDVRTVHRMARSGLLPSAMKIPGKTGAWLFDRSEVERIAAQRAAA
jgi:predicted site-specific integrase-resolvase